MKPSDEELRREIAALRDDPQPSAEADRRFADMLEKHATPRPTRHLRAAALLSIAASLLLVVFGLGWYFGQDESQQELAATRTLMLELMQNESSSTRIRAATVSLDLEVADPEVIANLGRMLRQDENTNVRLAALDALSRFADEPAARREMLDAMGEAPPPVVRLQLLEILVGLEEKRVLPYLEDLIQNDTLPQRLRDAAQLGAFKLI